MRLRSTIFLTAALCALVTNTALAQRDLKDIPIPDPELERKSFQVAEGFEVNLFAGDPKIAKPIQMNFDPQGRLWIASSEIYPHIKPGQKANDKITVGIGIILDLMANGVVEVYKQAVSLKTGDVNIN